MRNELPDPSALSSRQKHSWILTFHIKTRCRPDHKHTITVWLWFLKCLNSLWTHGGCCSFSNNQEATRYLEKCCHCPNLLKQGEFHQSSEDTHTHTHCSDDVCGLNSLRAVVSVTCLKVVNSLLSIKRLIKNLQNPSKRTKHLYKSLKEKKKS